MRRMGVEDGMEETSAQSNASDRPGQPEIGHLSGRRRIADATI